MFDIFSRPSMMNRRSLGLLLVRVALILKILVLRSLRPHMIRGTRLTFPRSRRVIFAMLDDPGLLAGRLFWIRVPAMAAAAATARVLGHMGSARVGAKENCWSILLRWLRLRLLERGALPHLLSVHIVPVHVMLVIEP